MKQIIIILAVLSLVTINAPGQTGWVVEEETNIKGTISGVIKDGHILQTISGNIYEVTGLSIQVVVEVSPDVVVLRKNDTYKLLVHGFDEPLICRRIKESSHSKTNHSANANTVIESSINGDFNGWEGETIFKLRNGQIWQQSSYAYLYHYAYSPTVMIYPANGGYKMHVEGVEETINVEKLK